MHLTRPKSSKGRTRPTVNHTQCGGDTASTQNRPMTPKCPEHNSSDSYLCSQPQPMIRQSSQVSQEEAAHMLQFASAPPALSLNKYKVLPSIERRRSEVHPGSGIEKKMSELNLCDHDFLEQQQRHRDSYLSTVGTKSSPEIGSRADVHRKVLTQPSDPGSVVSSETHKESSLLLAIRAPCSRRFQQHFQPTDTLLTLKASAEARYGTRYEEACIETMDVPRRTFTDLNMTLAQCGILNRSVLCIYQEDSLK
ncbi:UBX domain-containing protein 10 [Myripristis murdjan]|uniref:UBX domain-containing protein 10 n=1 Tax=Myripristis murdjan TaxID=586833 RepID=UPI001175FF1D|nr:UBX domain-containing protein 10 [Myripristis murdjan]